MAQTAVMRAIVPEWAFWRERGEEPDLPFGRALVGMVLDPSWTHRRVETIQFVGATRVRRRISVDISLPQQRSRTPARGAGRRVSNSERRPAEVDGSPVGLQHLVPVGALKKQSLVALDVRDEAGSSLPVLSKVDSDWATWSMVVALAEGIGHGRGARTREVWDALRRFAFAGSPAAATGELRELRQRFRGGWPLAGRPGEAFDELLGWLVSEFLLFVPVAAEPGRRRVLKYSYDDAVPWPPEGTRMERAAWSVGLGVPRFAFDLSGHGLQPPYHLELQAPD